MVGSLGEMSVFTPLFPTLAGPRNCPGSFLEAWFPWALSPENLSHCQSDEGTTGGIFLVEEELG